MVYKTTTTRATKPAQYALRIFVGITLLQLLAYWDAWQWYLTRLWFSPQEGIGFAATVGILCLMAGYSYRQHKKIHRVPPLPIIVLLLTYSLSYLFAPALVRTAIAVTSVLLTIYLAFFTRRPPIAFWGMVLLSLPVVPSLQFYLGYPARLMSAEITVPLLQMNGLSVIREGTYLVWNNKMLQFDAPCSGVTMLWAGLFFTFVIAFFLRFDIKKMIIALFLTAVIVLIGNVLRASSLFYLEVGLFPSSAVWWHQGVGVVVFIMTAFTLMFLLLRLNLWRATTIK